MSLLDIMVIEDEADIRELISDILKDEGFNVRLAANSAKAFELISEKIPSAIILDIWLQRSELDGLGILEIVKKRYPLLPIIIISGHGTIETAVNAIKMGAYDYLEKPFTQDKLLIMLKRACEVAKLKRENFDLKSKVADRYEIIGNSAAINKLKSEIDKVAPTSGRIMITGEAGSGKELAARLIHKKSKRTYNPFIVYNPTGLSVEKIQKDLFGDYENNFAGSISRKLSVLEAAHNGTLYIDEVGDLPLTIQTKLLRFLQDSMFERPSNGQSIKLDIRLITSTSKNLQNDINNGKFRQDLFYRLNVVPLKVPSLAERKDDIPLLVIYFLKYLAKFSGLPERHFADESTAALQAYNWPGNIRQLRNVVEWTLIMNPGNAGNLIKHEMLPNDITSNTINIIKTENNMDMMSMPLREAREIFEKQYLIAQMSRFNNNISKTSLFVGMERSALHRKLKLLNIHTSSGKCSDEMEEKILISEEEVMHS